MSYMMKLINLLMHLNVIISIASLAACSSGRNEKLTIYAIEKKESPLQIIMYFKSKNGDIWMEGKNRINCHFTPKNNNIAYSYTGSAEKNGLNDYVVFLNAMRNQGSTTIKDAHKIIDTMKKSRFIECNLFENNYFGNPKLNGSFTIPTRDILN